MPECVEYTIRLGDMQARHFISRLQLESAGDHDIEGDCLRWLFLDMCAHAWDDSEQKIERSKWTDLIDQGIISL